MNALTLRNDKKRSELNELVARSLADAKNEAVPAADSLFDRVKRRQDLYEYVADPLVRSALYDMVRSALRSKRIRVWDAKVITNNKTGVQQLARANYSMLDDFTVEGYGALGDVTREQLENAVKFYRDQAVNMSEKARFLSLVARSTKEGKTVRECLSNKDVLKLRERARAK